MSIYSIITDQIVKKVEDSGQLPWERPWYGGKPKNLISKKPYRGINLMLLDNSKYKSDYYVSFNQCKKLGGHVRKGEKSQIVVFYKPNMYATGKDDNGDDILKIKGFILRYYRVFNIEQCDNIDTSKIPALQKEGEKLDFSPVEVCENLIKSAPIPQIRFKEQRAYYRPSEDYINMPKPETFTGTTEYYSVLFHEMVHSTGHKDRLNRKNVSDGSFFGSTDYSKEELVAEIGASFLCGQTGIETPKNFDNHAAYVKSWLSKLKNDVKMIVIASAQAEKAVTFLNTAKA